MTLATRFANKGQTLDWVILLALLLIAATLRLHQYNLIPYPHETDDEYAWVWSGWCLVREGAPCSWSWKGAYPAATTYLLEQHEFRLVSPWFDHPLLFGLLTGGLTALVVPGDSPLDAPIWPARLVAVALGTLSVGLLYALGTYRYGRLVGFLAGTLLATVPTMVLASRLALAENLIVPLFLAALLAALRYLRVTDGNREDGAERAEPASDIGDRSTTTERPSTGWAWLAIAMLLAFAATSAKVPGLTVGVAVAILLAANRQWWAAVLVGGSGLLGLLPYVGYGLLADARLFLAVLADQGSRANGLETLPRLLIGSADPPVAWRDAWIPFLWLTLAYAACRKDRLLLVCVVPYLIFLVAAVAQSEPRVWYRVPLYPAFCLAGAIFLRDALRKPDPLSFCLLLFGVTFGKLAECLDAWNVLARLPLGTKLYPLMVALLALPALTAIVWSGRAAKAALGVATGVAIAVAVGASISMVIRVDYTYPLYHPSIEISPNAPRPVAGVELTRFAIEPDVVVPSGGIRVTTRWAAQRDIDNLKLELLIRSFDRKNRAIGQWQGIGTATLPRLASPQEVTQLIAGTLPSDLTIGDCEVGLRVGDEALSLGVIRARATSAALPIESLGRPARFESVYDLVKVAIAGERVVESGTILPVFSRLESRAITSADYHTFLHLTTAEGRIVAQHDGQVGDSRGEWRDLLVPSTTPPGVYYLSTGIYEYLSGRRLQAGTSNSVPLGQVEIGTRLSDDDVPVHLGTDLAGGVRLVGYDLAQDDRQRARITLYWRTTIPIAADYTVFVHVLDDAGNLRAQSDGAPAYGRAPTSTWRTGQIIVDTREIDLSALANGRYRVTAGLYEAPNGPRVDVFNHADGYIEVTSLDVS